MVLGRPIEPLVMQEGEREVLLSWTRRSKSAQAHALRARIVLLCADGLTNQAVAEELRVASLIPISASPSRTRSCTAGDSPSSAVTWVTRDSVSPRARATSP